MILGLLWIEVLLACLLFAAVRITSGLRYKSRLARWAACGTGVLLPLVVLGGPLAATAFLRFVGGMRHGGFNSTAALVVCYLVSAAIVVAVGTRRDQTGARRARSWPLWRLVLALLVVAGLIVMGYWNLSRQMQAEVQALRKEAGALAVSMAGPPISDSANAASQYRLAHDQYQAAVAAGDKPDEYAYTRMDPQSAEVAAHLQRQQQALETIRRAAEMPACRLQADYSHPSLSNTRVEELNAFRESASLLAVAAKAQAAAGNVDMALADCRRIYAMGRHPDPTSQIINALVSMAIDSLASKTVAQVLPSATSSAQLAGFSAPDPQALAPAFADDLRGEEALGMTMICDIASGKRAAPGGIPPAAGGVLWLLWLREDMAGYRELMHREQRLVQQPYCQTVGEWQQIRSNLGRRNGYGLMTGILMPDQGAANRAMVKVQVFRLAVGVALAATRYWLDHGDYPPTVAALVPDYLPAIPVDPFDGQPLRFKKSSDGSVVIYSVGPDGKDNGGQVEAQSPHEQPSDVGFILKPPAAH
jgi:hypothetical protein